MKTIPLFSSLLLFGYCTCFAEPEAVAEVEPESETKKTPPAPQEPKPSILTFADQSRITGFSKGIDAAMSQLTLDSPSLLGETQLKTDQLLEMTLNGTPKDFETDHYALATIEKHFRDPHMDTIRGRLVALDDNSITLETWYAGQLTLQRSMVRSLDIFSRAPSFYNGPNGPEGWVSSDGDIENSWTFKNRTMISKARVGAAREVDIPEKAKISFTADWRTYPGFRLFFFSDKGDTPYPGTGYSLSISRTFVSLYRSASQNNRSDIISKSIQNLMGSETAVFTVYLDRSKDGINAFYIDDQEVGTWTGVDDTTFEGDWIHFVPQNTNPTRFSNISIAQWDGKLPVKVDPTEEGNTGGPKPEELEGQEIRLANGDVVIGSVNSIENGMARLSTSFGDVGVPIKLMRSVALSDQVDEPRMEPGDVRAWFHEGGYITIKLKALNETTIKGYSQVWGDAEFDLDAFSRIEFNIWRRELSASRYDTDTDW